MLDYLDIHKTIKPDKDLKVLYEQMRAFSLDKKIVLVTPRAANIKEIGCELIIKDTSNDHTSH